MHTGLKKTPLLQLLIFCFLPVKAHLLAYVSMHTQEFTGGNKKTSPARSGEDLLSRKSA